MKKLELKMQYLKYWVAVLAITIITFTFLGDNRIEAASPLRYQIKVNKQQNCVTIYEKDKKGAYTVPVKALICSTGADTPIGTFKTPAKYRWKLLMGDVWGQYSTRIHGGILFHSVWYYQKDPSTLSATQYNKLGTTCSHGCVRLTVEGAKWIYDNCPIGTTVIVYNSKDPGPLGKPSASKLAAGTGWDPTDIWSLKNPFNKSLPMISGAKNQTVKYGATVDLTKNIEAKTSIGVNAMDKMKIKIVYNTKKVSKVNTKKAGAYKVIYSITDELGRTVSKNVTITVKKDISRPILAGVKDRVIKSEISVNREFALENVSATYGGKKLSKDLIKSTITKVDNYTYTIKYTITKNGKTAKATSYISIDTEAPLIYGVKDRTVDASTVVDEELALKGISVGDDVSSLSNEDIQVAIVDNEDDTFTITYTLKDDVGNKTIEKALFSVQ